MRFARRLQALEERVKPFRRFALLQGIPIGRDRVGALRWSVEINARTHVEQLPNGDACIGRRGHFRQIARDRRVDVEIAACLQDSTDKTDDRLGC
jgi:hypothetical protein